MNIVLYVSQEMDQNNYYYNLHQIVLPMISSKNFMLSGLRFRSLIHHFQFIFVYDVRKCSNLIVLHVAAHCIFLPPLSQIDHKCMDLFLDSGLCAINLCPFFLFLLFQCHTFFFSLSTFFTCRKQLTDLSSPTRDQTQAPAVKVLSPNHWTTRKFPPYCFN